MILYHQFDNTFGLMREQRYWSEHEIERFHLSNFYFELLLSIARPFHYLPHKMVDTKDRLEHVGYTGNLQI